jgi:DNA-binding XRE family transcriptional regulator
MRKKLGVSQERIGLEADCDRTTVSLIERGLVSPKLETIVKMCRVIRVKPSEVMRRMEESSFYRAYMPYLPLTDHIVNIKGIHQGVSSLSFNRYRPLQRAS